MNVISCRLFVPRAIVRNSGIVSAVMAVILAISACSQSATIQAATLTLGDQVSDTLLLEQLRLSIVLPEGKWRVSGLIEPHQGWRRSCARRANKKR